MSTSESKKDAPPSSEEILDEVIDSCRKVDIDDGDGKSKGENSEEGDEKNDDFIDEDHLKELDASSSPEDLQKRKGVAIECKDSGNSLFKNEKYDEARTKYSEALRTCPLEYKEERAIMYANRAAAKVKQNLKKEAIEDCTRAIDLNPKYVKAFIRRARLLEETDKLNDALEDYKKILELDPGNSEARAAAMRLPGQINEQNERLKAEMLGSLKELGNKLLKPFGLSTDNFQVEQDPSSGKYSVNFRQSK